MIQVRRTAEHDSFEVVVREGTGESRHHVTMSREMCERLTAGTHTPERCLEVAFRFYPSLSSRWKPESPGLTSFRPTNVRISSSENANALSTS